ncbi:MAG: CvpA family protein [Spirochaetota bacterium]
MSLSVIDIISLVILIVAAIRITFKGFVTEFMSKAGLLVGLLAALMFTNMVAPFFEERLQIGAWSNVVAFIVLFVVGYLLMRLLSSAIKGVLEALHLNVLDNMLGFVLGVLEGAIVISFIVFLLRLQTFMDVGPLLESSWVVELLEPIAPHGIELVKGEFSSRV